MTKTPMRSKRSVYRFLQKMVLLASLGGCVSEQPWDRAQQNTITSRSFAGHTSADLLRAAEIAFRRSDPKNTSFDYQSDGFIATRRVSAYFVIAAMNGNYQFRVSTTRNGDKSILSIKAYANLTAITAAGAQPSAIGTFVESKGTYDLMFERVSYALGDRESWLGCAEARSELNVPSGELEPVCLAAHEAAP